jgi:hypothetical protein
LLKKNNIAAAVFGQMISCRTPDNAASDDYYPSLGRKGSHYDFPTQYEQISTLIKGNPSSINLNVQKVLACNLFEWTECSLLIRMIPPTALRSKPAKCGEKPQANSKPAACHSVFVASKRNPEALKHSLRHLTTGSCRLSHSPAGFEPFRQISSRTIKSLSW